MVENHISFEMAENRMPWSSPSPTSPTSSTQEAVTPTEHPASARSESMSDELRGNSEHGSEERKPPKKWRQRSGTGSPVAWSARMATGFQGKYGRWKCSRTPRRFQFFSWITYGTASKSGTGQAQYIHSLPEGPNLRYLLRNQNYKGLLQKTCWCPERNFVCDLITADHKVLSEGCGSRHNRRYAVVVQDLATQRDSARPSKDQRFFWCTRRISP